jgi:hypothetical protein
VQHPGKNEIVSVSRRPGCLSNSILARDARAYCVHHLKMSTALAAR